ncbi:MAG: DNA polymerase III subunit chi [Deltaproteobacteria bacterium]|nr:DNA polymerase III subunit chi [Deltaproteobacteria bacterium]
MTEVIFVEVTASRMEMRTCEIAEHSYAQGDRLQIIAIDEEQAARLDDLLWTYKPGSFVPHGLWKGMDSESDQPVIITTRKERVPGITSLLTMDYCPVKMVQQFSKIIHVVVVDNQERLEASRRYWTLLKDAGFTLRHQRR